MLKWNWQRALLTTLATVLFVGAVLLGLAYSLNSFLVDLWWFSALGYERLFWHQLLDRYGLFLAGVLIFFLIFFLNFRLGVKYLGAKHPALRNAGIASSTSNPILRRRPYQRNIDASSNARFCSICPSPWSSL